MFRFFFTSVAACILCVTSAFAEDDDADALALYLDEAKVSAIGACDGRRSTLMLLVGGDDETTYEVAMFSPARNSSLRFYIVAKESGSEYFIRRFKDGNPPEIQKLEPVDWALELMPHSMNFYYAAFSQGRDHDCGVITIVSLLH